MSTIEGYAAVFDSLSSDLGGFREKIAPGAFSRSIREYDILALHHHRHDKILGRTSNKTLALFEDRKGLFFSLQVPDTGLGNDIATLVKIGSINSMSFGFYMTDADGEYWEHDPHLGIVRTLLDVDLSEISTVGRPAYPASNVSIARSAVQSHNVSKFNVENARRHIRMRTKLLSAMR